MRTRKLKTTTKKNLEPGHVLAEAAHLLVLREDLALGGAAAGELQRRVGAALAAEGVAQLGEAVELAVLREEHLHHGAHRDALVLDGVRRGLRRELARVDQPAQRLPLLLGGVRMRLSEMEPCQGIRISGHFFEACHRTFGLS